MQQTTLNPAGNPRVTDTTSILIKPAPAAVAAKQDPGHDEANVPDLANATPQTDESA